MPFRPCYRRVGHLPDPDLCCPCVGTEASATRAYASRTRGQHPPAPGPRGETDLSYTTAGTRRIPSPRRTASLPPAGSPQMRLPPRPGAAALPADPNVPSRAAGDLSRQISLICAPHLTAAEGPMAGHNDASGSRSAEHRGPRNVARHPTRLRDGSPIIASSSCANWLPIRSHIVRFCSRHTQACVPHDDGPGRSRTASCLPSSLTRAVVPRSASGTARTPYQREQRC